VKPSEASREPSESHGQTTHGERGSIPRPVAMETAHGNERRNRVQCDTQRRAKRRLTDDTAHQLCVLLYIRAANSNHRCHHSPTNVGHQKSMHDSRSSTHVSTSNKRTSASLRLANTVRELVDKNWTTCRPYKLNTCTANETNSKYKNR